MVRPGCAVAQLARSLTIMLSLTLLGPLTIARDGRPLTGFRSQTEIALLVYLAHTGQTHSREALGDLLWEARSTSQSLSNLRTALARLRKVVGDELLITRKSLAIRPEAIRATDSVRLAAALQTIGTPQTPEDVAQLRTAVELYGGEFLAGFYLPDATRFNDWVAIEQERLRQQVAGGLQRLITYALQHEAAPLGIAAARQWLAIDDLHETAHAHLIHFLALDGQTSAALAQYDRLATLLDEEIGLQPAPDTAALADRIRQGAYVSTAINRKPPETVSNNLPREMTPFFGRSRELLVVTKRLLDPAYPLITLIGEGGIGKTRLALATARKLIADAPATYPDGVWFVTLAGLDAQTNVQQPMAEAIGSAMGLSFHGDRLPSDQLLTLLQDKTCLIVLDNMEHLLETDAPDLAIDLLRAASGVTLLVTSRAPLDLSSEFSLRLGGLPVPPADVPDDSDSVRLFVERATRRGEEFDLAACATPVTTICRLVDGVPLAIELAAGWVGRMSCDAIAAAIAANLDFLSTRHRDIPIRHRSLRAVFDYSWALLSSAGRQALAQASIFRGGFDQEGSAAVMGSCAAQVDYLVDHSLLQQVENDRYTIHEQLREYAAERLAAPPDKAGDALADPVDVRRRHAAYYIGLVGAVSLVNDPAETSVAVVRADRDNVRAAWRWAVEGPHPDALARAWQGLWTFYTTEALFQEGDVAFERALAALSAAEPEPETDAVAVRLRVALAHFRVVLNQYDDAIALAQTILRHGEDHAEPLLRGWARLVWGTALWRQGHFRESLSQFERGLGDQPEGLGTVEADLRRRIGTSLLELGDLRRARESLQRAGQIYRQATMRRSEAYILNDLGWLEQRAHHSEPARDYLTAALTIQRELGNRHATTMILINLAGVCGIERRFEAAVEYLRQALDSLTHVDDRYHRSLINHGLGLENARLGDTEQAMAFYERSIAIDRAVGDEAGVAWSQNNLGLAYNHLGQFDTALGLHTTALRTAQRLGARTSAALSHSRIGQDLFGLERYVEAAVALEEAVAIQTTLQQTVWAIESRAGLAVTYLALGRTAEALALVEALLPTLNDEDLRGAREPFRVCWNCFRVLAAAGDPRAQVILAQSCQDLEQQAATIVDKRLQHAFLHNIPSHRELLAARDAAEPRAS